MGEDQLRLEAKVGPDFSAFSFEHEGTFQALKSGFGIVITERCGFLVKRFGGG